MKHSTQVNRLLSDIIINWKYARYLEEKSRRETWREIVKRNVDMHKEYYKDTIQESPEFGEEIDKHYQLVYDKKVLPSMRSLQFAGKSVFKHPNRIYNCAYLPIDHPKAFSEIMFLSLCGTGVGYSVQYKHIAQLPTVKKPAKRKRRYLIPDSIEGWADAMDILMNAYFDGKSTPVFDYSDIRPQGEPLKTSGGLAPGPAPLKRAIQNITAILDSVEQGERLKSLEVHDIICHMADVVVSGGIRRSALISLFSFDDEDMITCKYADNENKPYYAKNPQRAMANNSAIALRHRINRKDFEKIMRRIKNSHMGEPGIVFSNDADYGTNPCAEIALRGPGGLCNLTEISVSNIKDEEDFIQRCEAAAFIGTLQAGYTDFHYLRPCWQDMAEKEALIGVGLTGIAANTLTDDMLEKGSETVMETNERVAWRLGINTAARATTVKPAGTTSLVLGCSSGVHACILSIIFVRYGLIKKNRFTVFLRNTCRVL